MKATLAACAMYALGIIGPNGEQPLAQWYWKNLQQTQITTLQKTPTPYMCYQNPTFNPNIMKLHGPIFKNSPHGHYITQHFAQRPRFYSKYNLKGHNGIDYRTRSYKGDSHHRAVHSVTTGVAKVINQGRRGYGLHVRVENEEGMVIYAHLQTAAVKDGQQVRVGTILGYTGGMPGSDTAGDSDGPHLHFEVRPLVQGGYMKGNGFAGAVDPLTSNYIVWYGSPHQETKTARTGTALPSPWAAEAWESAVAHKLLEDKDPQGPVTREMLAVVIQRMFKAAKWH